jgi:hypothetical protein
VEKVNKMDKRYTGIIRTLPSLYGDSSIGAKKYQRSIALLEQDKIPAVYIALSAVPRIEVLHLYLLIEGKVQLRLNIAGYESGDSRKCWDDTIRTPKIWVVCTAPVSRPVEPVLMRGFQGFRYTEGIW